MKSPKLLVMLILVFSSLTLANSNSVRVLVLLSKNYGPNYFLNRDAMDQYGWDITLAGLTEEVNPCPLFDNVFPVAVDSLMSDINDISYYDVLAIMPASWRSGSPFANVLADSVCLSMIKTAVDTGMVVWTSCAGVRVLAAIDVLDGKTVVGTERYQEEYTAAGAIYLGEDHYPVTDGNIITCVRDQYYYKHNINAIADAVEKAPRMQTARTSQAELTNTSINSLDDEDLVWARAIGGPESEGGTAIVRTGDGGFAITGYTFSNSNGYADLLLIKTDANGNTLWTQTFGGEGWEYGYGLAEIPNGGFVVAGYTTMGANKDVYVIKTDASGNLLWEKTFGESGIDVAYSVCVTREDEILLCGYTHPDGDVEEDLSLIKTDAQGNVLWTKRFGEERSEIGQAVKQAADGTFMVVGITGSSISTGNMDVWLLNVSQNGDLLWQKAYGNAQNLYPFDWASSLCCTDDGNWLIAGHTNAISPMEAFVIMTDSAGNRIWEQNYGDTFYDYASDICMSGDGCFFSVGASRIPGTLNNDMYLRYYDRDGSELWTKTVGGEKTDWATSVCTTKDGFVVLGYTTSFGSGKTDLLITKLSNVYQDFEIIPNSGHAPLEVQFKDKSRGYLDTWEWDLDGDGSVDSNEQDPIRVYNSPGEYNVSFRVGNGTVVKSCDIDSAVRVFNGESSLRFNNDSSYVCVPATDTLNLTDALTLELWAKLNSFGTFEVGRIIDKVYWTLHLNGDMVGLNTNSLCFFQSNSGGSMCITNTPENSIVLDQWQHLAVTYEATNSEIHLYINGVDQEVGYLYGEPTGPIFQNLSQDLTIGNSIQHDIAFNGLLDEVRVWNVARTGDEIRANMYDYVAGDTPGLVGYWQMNKGNGNELIDISSCANNATMGNALWENGIDVLTGIQGPGTDNSSLPGQFALEQNYPNPFNPATTIAFALPQDSFVTMQVYDINGRLVRTLADLPHVSAGHHALTWDGTDNYGGTVSTGVYFCRLRAKDFTDTRKMVYIR